MEKGMMYENRKSRRVAVVESINDKYKTVELRDKDGKAFNQTFSSMKSNWRIYKGDLVIETSDQVEESRAENEKRKKNLTKKKGKARLSPVEKASFINDATEVIRRVVIEKYNSEFTVSADAKGGIRIKKANSTMFEIWAKAHLNQFNIRVKDEHYDSFKSYMVDGIKEVYYEKDAFQHSIRGFDIARLEELVVFAIDTISPTMKSGAEKKQKNETEEE